MESALSLREQIREDWETHSRRTLLPGLHAVVLHRIGRWGARQPIPLRLIVKVVYRLLNNLVIRNVYGIEIYPTTVIGRRVRIPHHVGVILGATSVIGSDVLVRQGVTLGRANVHGPDAQPTIEDHVELGAGATIVGGVRIGEGAKVGPGAVIITDVPAGASAFAPPTRILRKPEPAQPTESSAPGAPASQ